MKALKQGLNPEPSRPQGFPAWRAIAAASEIATQTGNLSPEDLGRHVGRIKARLGGNHGEQVSFDHLTGWPIWTAPGDISQLQQANGDGRKQPQQTEEPFHRLELALLKATPGFEALMIVFDDPAMTVPVGSLPRLLKGGSGQGGQQDPLQWLHAFRGVFFPETKHPQREGLLLRPWLVSRWQQGHRPKGQVQVGRASRSCMTGWNLERTTLLAWPCSGLIEQVANLFVLILGSSILSSPHQKVGVCRLAGMKEVKHVRATIPDMNDRGGGRNGPKLADQAHPDVGFSLLPKPTLTPTFLPWGGSAHKRLLLGTSQHLPLQRQDCQHRLQMEASSSFIADLTQATHLMPMAQIDFGGVLNQQDDRVLMDLFSGLLPMRLHQGLKGDFWRIQQTIQGDDLFPALHLGRQGGRGIRCHLTSHLNHSPDSACVFQLARSKRVLCPELRVQHLFGSHRPILSASELCIKDSLSKYGVLHGSEMQRMRAARLSLCLFALTAALCLAGCGQSRTSQDPLPHAPSPAVHQTASPAATQTPLLERKAKPVRLLIPAIGVNALIETVGVTPGGDLAVPTQNPWEDVGWYESGPHPGELGSAVIDGHLDRPGGYPAVFWHLRDLQVGNAVTVIDAYGKTFHFHVTGTVFYSPQGAPIQQIFANNSGAYLNLITCAGDWIPSQHQTTLRLVVYTALD